MLNQAVQKLQDEIKKNKGNPAIMAVGEFLIGHLKQNSQDAKKIMQDKTTITGAMDDMKKHAQKKQKNGYAVIAPEEGFKIVMDYFGISSAGKTTKSVIKQAPHVPESPESVHKTVKAAFGIDLDDLL